MIVVSGVLVAVALVLLILGLFGDGLTFIWASIITSVIAGVFLLLGALQRRGTPATASDAGPASSDTMERVTAVSVRPREDAAAETAGAFADDSASDEAAAASGGEVSVVPGRPRYHTAGCRFLAGRPDVQAIPVEDARGEGYTACGVCKPDAALAAAAEAPSAPAVEEPAADEPAEAAPVLAADEPAATEETAVLAAPGRARKAPAKKAAAAPRATKAIAAAGTTAAAAKPAAKATASSVVAVPDRGKYHTETCRFAQNAPGALNMSKASAKRQGLAPCGVCKPG